MDKYISASTLINDIGNHCAIDAKTAKIFRCVIALQPQAYNPHKITEKIIKLIDAYYESGCNCKIENIIPEIKCGTFFNCEDCLNAKITAIIENGENTKNVRQKNRVWIPTSSGKFPEVEERVFVQTENGNQMIAMYEHGSMMEDDSTYLFETFPDDSDWDKERKCFVIPSGWYQVAYLDGEYIVVCQITEKVVAWRNLPEEYEEK